MLWRLARNTTGLFADDANAEAVVYEGNDAVVLDYQGLRNGVTYFYKVYYSDGTVWDASYPVVQVVAGLAFADLSTDPQALLRERLDDGLNALIANGGLALSAGGIAVLTATPPIGQVALPVVTVQLQAEKPDTRFLGDFLNGGFDAMQTGWQASVMLEIVAWCQGGDERKALRQAIKSLVIANLEVFAFAGMQQIQLTVSDDEDCGHYPCPVYCSRLIFQCTCFVGIGPTLSYPVLNNTLAVSSPYD